VTRWWPPALRRRSGEHALEQLDAVLERSFHLAPLLPATERARHRELTAQLVSRWRWEAARGLTLTDEMKLVVAAHAAMLIVGLDEGIELYRPVTSVILHRSTIVQHGPRPGPVPGLMTDGPDYLVGQAHHRGPVLLAWNTVRAQSHHPERGQHVVYHEMAHRLDMLDGITDGTPPLGDADFLAEWASVFNRELATLRAGATSDALGSYATTNPAEFFAVATETFFCRPASLHEQHRQVYELLGRFYRLDPVSWSGAEQTT
jgi:MtfA peptidase